MIRDCTALHRLKQEIPHPPSKVCREKTCATALTFFLLMFAPISSFDILLIHSAMAATAPEPHVVGTLDLPWASGVFASGSNVYVTAAEGVVLVDASDVTNPVRSDAMGEIPNVKLWDIYISGSTAYLAADTVGLLIMDISDIKNPALLGSVEIPIRAVSICVSGSYAYVATWGGGMYVVDVSNPQSPTIVGSVYDSSLNWLYGVHVSGKTAYLAASVTGLVVIDVSNPENPRVTETISTVGPDTDAFTCDGTLWADAVYVSYPYAFVGSPTYGLYVIDVQDPSNPKRLEMIQIDGGMSSIEDVYVEGPYAFLAAGSPLEAGLRIVDVSKYTGPDAPDILPSVTISVNQPQFFFGDTLRVDLTTHPGTFVDDNWDIYVAIFTPSDTYLFMTYSPSMDFSTTLLPARPLGPIVSESVTLLEISLPDGIAEGTWKWAAAAAKPLFTEIAEISWAPFTVLGSHDAVAQIAGTWDGIWTNQTFDGSGSIPAMSGNFSVDISQQGTILSGMIDISFLGQVPLKGTIQGDNVTFGDVNEEITFYGTVSEDLSFASGTYAYPFLNNNGTWNATKQAQK